jgi:hypothetical protein
MRMNFNQVFQINNGMVSPRAVVRVGGVQMGPGVAMGGGVQISGLSLTDLVGKDLEVELQDGVYVITGVYQ